MEENKIINEEVTVVEEEQIVEAPVAEEPVAEEPTVEQSPAEEAPEEAVEEAAADEAPLTDEDLSHATHIGTVDGLGASDGQPTRLGIGSQLGITYKRTNGQFASTRSRKTLGRGSHNLQDVVASQYGYVDFQTFSHLFIVDEPCNGGIADGSHHHLKGEVLRALDVCNNTRLATLTLRNVGIQNTRCIILRRCEEWVFVAGAGGEYCC